MIREDSRANKNEAAVSGKITFRKADAADAGVLVDIYNASFYDDYIRYGECPAYGRTAEAMRQSIIEYPKFLILYSSRPVGCVSCKEAGNGVYEIGCLCVIPEFQGRGIGTSAVEFVKTYFDEWKTLTLITPADKSENVRFYTKKCGFAIQSAEMDGNVRVARFILERNPENGLPGDQKRGNTMGCSSEDSEITGAAIEYIRSLFGSISDGHGFDHSLRVYHTAMQIAESEQNCDLRIVSLAALLHDADDHKLFSTRDNANARRFLNGRSVPADVAERICETINTVSFSRNKDRRPDTPEGRIVQDADRLDAIGAVGIARTFAFGGSHGRDLDSSIGHFHEKLLLLKDLMNTDKAREMAETRHAFMEAFLREWDEETGGITIT